MRDHPALLAAVVALMRRRGTVFFSTNHQNFRPSLEALPLTRAEEITHRSLPEDYRHKHKAIHRCWRLTV